MKLEKIKTTHGMLLVDKNPEGDTAIIKNIPQSPMYGYDDLIMISDKRKDPLLLNKATYTWRMTYDIDLDDNKFNGKEHLVLQDYLKDKGYKSSCPIIGVIYFPVPIGVTRGTVHATLTDSPIPFKINPVTE